MKFPIFLTFIILSTPISALAGATEQQYFETRDRFIESFKNKPLNNSKDQKGLEILERMIREIIGPIPLKNIQGTGRLNLVTLQQDGEFGLLDGLSFTIENSNLVVVTRTMLERYLKDNSRFPREFERLLHSDFYTNVFDGGAAFTVFSELPVQKKPNFDTNRAFLVLTAQDIGPFVPEKIVTVATKGTLIYFLSTDVAPLLPQIKTCEEAWKQTEAKDREIAFKNYGACYGHLAPSQPFFLRLLKQANTIAEQLR